jgi:CRP-like cAMP-binding protein
VVALHDKRDFFGEGCLTGQTRRLATATAMTDCELLRLDSAAIRRVIHEQTEFSEFFIARVLARHNSMAQALVPYRSGAKTDSGLPVSRFLGFATLHMAHLPFAALL